MRGKIVGLLFTSIILYSCKERCSNNLCLISADFWTSERHRNAIDSALYIGLYKETDKYLNYWTGLKLIPYKIDPALKNQYELVDDRTIHWNKGSRISNDYKLILKKGLIIFSDNNRIDDSLNGMMYVVRKKDGLLKSTSLVNFFEALKNNETARRAQSMLEEDKGFDEVSESLFNQHNKSF